MPIQLNIIVMLLQLVAFRLVFSAECFSIPFELVHGKIHLELGMGTPLKKFLKRVDQQIKFSWFTESFLSNHGSSTIKTLKTQETLSFPQIFKKIPSVLKEDILEINDAKINNFYFYQVKWNPTFSNAFITHSVTFAFKPKHEAESIPHLLYKSRIINSLQYSIQLMDNFGGDIYFGETPQSLIDNKKYKGLCRIVSENWECPLLRITVEKDGSIFPYCNGKSTALFQAGVEGIYAPKEFLIFLQEKLNTLLGEKKEKCNINQVDTTYYIKCPAKIERFIDNITFYLGDYLYVYNILKWTKCNKDECFISIYYKLEYNMFGQWILGEDFLRNFLSTFDYEKKIVVLRSNSVIIKRAKYPTYDIYFAFNMIIGILFFGIIVVSLCHIRHTSGKHVFRSGLYLNYFY